MVRLDAQVGVAQLDCRDAGYRRGDDGESGCEVLVQLEGVDAVGVFVLQVGDDRDRCRRVQLGEFGQRECSGERDAEVDESLRVRPLACASCIQWTRQDQIDVGQLGAIRSTRSRSTL